jgi:hypothetical protein
MNSPSREEIDAKLETIEARMDGRIAAIQASVDGLIVRLDERALLTDARFEERERLAEQYKRSDERLAEQNKRTDELCARIEQSFKEIDVSIKGLKTTVLIAAVSTVLTTVLGVGVFNAKLYANMLASFKAGTDLSATQSEVKRQVEATAALLQRLERAPANGAAAAPPSGQPAH